MRYLARFALTGALLGVIVLAITAILGTAQATTRTPTIRRTEVFVSAEVPNGQISDLRATCPRGYVVTGGGLGVGANDFIFADTDNPRTWHVSVGNFSSLPTASASADAICMKGTNNLAIRASLSKSDREQLTSQALRAHK